MKKVLSLVLVCVMLLGLCACGTSDTKNPDNATTAATAPVEGMEALKEGQAYVGFAAANITPDWPIGLQGFGNEKERISTGFKRYIYSMVLAITDAEGETVVIISVDAGGGGEWLEPIRTEVERQFGIPQDHIVTTAIHQHSTPTSETKYKNFVRDETVKAVQAALDDRAPATLMTNKVETTALNFVRHYWTNDDTIYTPNHGSAASGLKCHESDADNEMRLLKFVREGDKQPIVLVNFQTHPLKGTSSTDTGIHADWPGIMREEVEKDLGYHVMYVSGAGGNVDSTSSIKEENISEDWIHHGERAANYVVKAEKSYQEASLGDIRVKMVTNAYETDHTMDHMVDNAKKIKNVWDQKGLAAANEELKKYPEFFSVYHAKLVIQKSQLGPTTDLTVGAIAIGDVVFTTHPYEMFDTNGMELRAGTVGNENYLPEEQLENPYSMTIVCTLANGHLGYIPSRMGYTNGGYSTDITKVAPGTGERIVGDVLEIINELYNAK